jgi:DNA-binding CsgD family transcriptional regulator
LGHWKLPKALSSRTPRSASRYGSGPRASARLKWAPAGAGFLLVDSSGRVVCANADGRQILSYRVAVRPPQEDDRMLARSIGKLVGRSPHVSSQAEWTTQLTSGRRKYRCRAIPVALQGQRHVVLLIERTISKLLALSHSFDEYHLTRREQETAALLAKGFTNKEIAARMGLSVNTVKAFIRFVMLKVGVSTRTGIIARLAQMD